MRLVAVSSDDLRQPDNTSSEHFRSICASERGSELSILHLFHLFHLFLVTFYSPYLFFLLFFLSPFALLSFYTADYIYSCTLHCSKVSNNQISFPHRFAPRSHSHFVSVRPAHLGAPSQPSPITSLLRSAGGGTCCGVCRRCFQFRWSQDVLRLHSALEDWANMDS